MKLFGFEFFAKEPRWEVESKDINKDSISFVERDSESTAAIVSSSYSSGMYLDMMGNIRAEAELVSRYREMSSYPEMDNAIDEITNESITTEDDFIVKLDLSKAEMLDDNAKLVLHSIHNEIMDLLDFQSKAYWIFRRWYIDGRLYYHCVTDPKHLEEGIKELRYIDPRKMREIKEISPQKIPGAIDMNAQAQTMQVTQDYYLYNEKGFGNKASGIAAVGGAGMATSGIRITKDSVIHVPSGLSDPNGTVGLSYLQKSVKILNQLKTMEDAVIIYRLSRAPERRVWYVDVGNLPKQKADQYVRKVMTDQKNKLIYNSSSGEIQDSRKFLTLTEDYWLPKRADGSGTRVDTLQGGQNLGQMDDVLYFQKLLYNSLNVPIERLQSDTSPFQLGQDTQISRAEIKFGKFCSRLQQQFSLLFREALKKQCILKGLMSLEEFQVLEKLIKYEFAKDQHFTELKDQQILMMRANAFATMEQAGLIGRIYSMKWVRHEIFQQSDDDILEQTMEIIEDMQNPIYNMTNPASPQAQMEGGQEEGEEEQPEEEESDPGDEPAPEGSKNDHDQKIKRAKTVIDAIKSIPPTKRTPNDNKKLRSAAALVGKSPKHSADKK